MAVRIRLKRVGTKKQPFYRVVAVDSRTRRDGEVLEYLGQYQPVVDGEQFVVDETKTLKWLNQGAKPSDTILKMLKRKGIWEKYRTVKS